MFIVLVHLGNSPWGRHVSPLGQIIKYLSQPFFDLTHWRCMMCSEAIHTYIIAFGVTRPVLEPTIYRNGGNRVNSYTSTAVYNPVKSHKQ